MVRVTKEYINAAFLRNKDPLLTVREYCFSLLPIIDWLPRYNKEWLLGDLLCGITVGLVSIPQALAHAKLAGVPLEFGLYTSFIGVLAYAVFATSKDVTIGSTAVLSTLTGQLLATYNVDGIDPVVYTTTLAFLAGIMESAFGLLRLGMIVDLISFPVVVGFTTGAALQIIFGQISSLMGISDINTNDASYLVLVTTIKSLSKTKIDAIFGFGSILTLILLRAIVQYGLGRGYKNFAWLGHSANIIVMIIFTAISYACFNHASEKSTTIKLVGTIPQGLTYLRAPAFSIIPQLYYPALSIVLVGIIEHIAMTKAFGRINGYRADPNQEIIALGFTNIIGPFFGGYPATGSLSRSSIKSRSGVKTPLAGLFTGLIVILSIYFVTPLFRFIPSAVLSGIIIVSITDLIARPKVIKQLWEIDFFDFMSFLVACLVTLFVSIEFGIYSSVAFSLLVLLYRIARPKLQLMVREEAGAWVPYEQMSKNNPGTEPDTMPFPGIVVIRIQEALTYPNANYLSDKIKIWITSETARGSSKLAPDLLWNEKHPHQTTSFIDDNCSFGISNPNGPHLKGTPIRAMVFDFSAVNHIDASGLQILIDARNDAERWAGNRVRFLFANVHAQVRPSVEYFCLMCEEDRKDGQQLYDCENSSEFEKNTNQLEQDGNLSYWIHKNIDDAVATAQNWFSFGSQSSATIS